MVALFKAPRQYNKLQAGYVPLKKSSLCNMCIHHNQKYLPPSDPSFHILVFKFHFQDKYCSKTWTRLMNAIIERRYIDVCQTQCCDYPDRMPYRMRAGTDSQVGKSHLHRIQGSM